MSWAEIKDSINSSKGTKDFKPLDTIMRTEINATLGYERQKPISEMVSGYLDKFTAEYSVSYPSPAAQVNDICFERDGKLVALAVNDGQGLHFMQREGDTFLAKETGVKHTNSPQNLSFASQANYFTHDKKSVIYRYDENYEFTEIPFDTALPTDTTSCSLSPDGNIAAFIHFNVFSFYKRDGDRYVKFEGFIPTITDTFISCKFSPDGKYFAVSRNNKSPHLSIYRVNGDTCTLINSIRSTPIEKFAFSYDGKFLATIEKNSRNLVYLHTMRNGVFTQCYSTSSTANMCSLSFSPDNSFFCVGLDGSPYVALYKMSHNAFKATTPPTNKYNTLTASAFSPGYEMKNYLFLGGPTASFLQMSSRRHYTVFDMTLRIAEAVSAALT